MKIIILFVITIILLKNIIYNSNVIDYAFITTIPPIHLIKSKIFNIVLSNLISIVHENGIIIIFYQNYINHLNANCRKCIFIKIKKYVIFNIIGVIILELHFSTL